MKINRISPLVKIIECRNCSTLIHSPVFCQLWSVVVTTFDIIGLHLMALDSIERYLLVFHHAFLARYRLFLSTLPMVICILYPATWYITATYASWWWCTYQRNYSQVECGLPCYMTNSVFYLSFIIYGHHLLPVFTTNFANLTLIIAVSRQKAKMKRSNSWRKKFMNNSSTAPNSFPLPHSVATTLYYCFRSIIYTRPRKGHGTSSQCRIFCKFHLDFCLSLPIYSTNWSLSFA
jgi:hypothetical protein